MATSRMFTVDKFLGINEFSDGATELKMGEASIMENFTITDGFNLQSRPGIRRVDLGQRDPKPILAAWSGFIGKTEYLVICDFDSHQDRIFLYSRNESDSFTLEHSQSGALGITSGSGNTVKVFAFAGYLYIMSQHTVVFYTDTFEPAPIYIPKVIIGASPAGGGTALENINMLTSKRRITYSADGTSSAYVLPDEAVSIEELYIDNLEQTLSSAGTFDQDTHTFTFNEAPVTGVGNVEFVYSADVEGTNTSYKKIAATRLVEAYNGATDTRLFFAGDGSNICYYSGVPESGDLSQLYFPAMNEVAVDMSDSPVTGLIRHYSKLLVFKPDGAFSISYDTVTLADGSTIAGFYLRNINQGFGNDSIGQVQTVNNYPRTLSQGGIYEWRITTSYYKDERYAKKVSDYVNRTLESAESEKIVTCDDNVLKNYYVFLGNDTVLVNRYNLTSDGLWCVYKSPVLNGVKSAFQMNGTMVFCNEKEAFYFDDSYAYDENPVPGGDPLPVKCLWESGFMSFGADFRRKHSSNLYISTLPNGRSQLTVTASTDRREEYMEKSIESDLFSWPTISFPEWTFNLNSNPEIKRIRLKVKKFVYYKLILKVEKPNVKTTVLGYDQEVRYSSNAK